MFDRMPIIVWSRDRGHAHLGPYRENYLCFRSAFPNTKPRTKFEVSKLM